MYTNKVLHQASFLLTEAVSIVCGSALWFFVIQKMYRIGGESGNLCGGLWYSGVKVWSYRFDSTMWRTVKRTQFGFYRRTLCKLMKNNKFAYRKLQISLGFSSRRRSDYRAKEVGSDGSKASHSPLQTALESFSVSAIKTFVKHGTRSYRFLYVSIPQNVHWNALRNEKFTKAMLCLWVVRVGMRVSNAEYGFLYKKKIF